MENKEQSSLEVGIEEFVMYLNQIEHWQGLRERHYVEANKKALIKSLADHKAKMILADQKRKIFLWFHNWLIQKELNMKLKDWSSTELKRDFDKEF